MSASHYQRIDEVLRLLAECDQRASEAACAITREGGEPHLVEALELLDRELLRLHRALLDGTILHAPEPAGAQLVLGAS